MYAKRVQIHNYGPINRLDISFPFDSDQPKPVLLVGENGSGKSIFLSHVVNGLVSAKGVAYAYSPEVETNRVYKLRSNSYIKSGSEYYFGRVEFEDGIYLGEMRTLRNRGGYEKTPRGIEESEALDAWEQMDPNSNDHPLTSIVEPNNEDKIKEIFANNCVLYFPPNRFEEPAWLNEENLKAKAKFMGVRYLSGQTDRRIISYSPLHDNQDWLFDVIYDMNSLEIRTDKSVTRVDANTTIVREYPVYSGRSTAAHIAATQIAKVVTQNPDASFGIGPRHNRVVSLKSATGQIVPNIFQLSSGETALLNLFLSILRDFDLTRRPFDKPEDIRGIVVVDEIDLHLHSIHQNEVLPALIKMFPKVQFVVTTHSPLFVLGMDRLLGEDGFAVYRLPEGQQISPEEFSEFGDAYQAFAGTTKHSRELQAAIENAQKPIAFVEGKTDIKYIQKAAELLDKDSLLDKIELRVGGGADEMGKAWNGIRPALTGAIGQKVMFLFDCDTRQSPNARGNFLKRVIPQQTDNPLQKGIENLFGKETLNRARQHKAAFINVSGDRVDTEDGQDIMIPASWSVNRSQKTNLCRWLCENGIADDFRGFQVVFELLEELIEEETVQVEASTETGN